MCGILGIVSKNSFSTKDLMKALKNLEYRGYDSCGYATCEGFLEKDVGEISRFMKKMQDKRTKTAISHTRWATHGGVTQKNAHPHFDCRKRFFIVHNGIIENFLELKREFEERHKFSSETDSELIAHFFEEEVEKGSSIKNAIKKFFDKFKGTYAVLLMEKEKNRIYAFKKDSPLVLGLVENGFYVSSDIYGFSEWTNKAIFFEDYEFAIIDANSFVFYSKNGDILKKEVKEFEVLKQEITGKFPHYMIKEIHESPIVVRRLIDSLEREQRKRVEKLVSLMREAERILFVAAGTSYHASLLGVYFFHKVGVEAHTIIASEFQNFMLPGKKTLVIAISQSGETMDVVKALKYAKKKGAKIASIVNVPYSTVQRMSETSIEILAGQEICVAATKTFTNQVALLLYLASRFGYKLDVKKIPEKIEIVILENEEKVKKLAKKLSKIKDIYVIGRGLSYPVAREFALKLKEIPYIHAEGMMGGELKHGTIALIEEGVPVISLISNKDYDMISNTKEVEARGAQVILISNNKELNPTFYTPTSNDGKFCILSTILGQLLSYYIAKEKGLPIDKPRNLAKSVTVE